VAEAAEGLALIAHACARREEIALAAGQEVARGQAVDQPRERRAYLNLVIDRLAENIQVGAVELGEVVPLIGAAFAEQVVQPFVGEAGDLRQPPMRILEQETARLNREQRDLASLESGLTVVVDPDAFDRQ